MANKSVFASIKGRLLPATNTQNAAGAPAYRYSDAHALKRVQVHAGHLPRRVFSDLCPMFRGQIQLRQHLERHVWNSPLAGFLKPQEILHRLWQQRDITWPPDDPSKQSFARLVPRLWVHHLDHIRQGRIVPNIGLQDRPIGRRIQPVRNHPLWRRAKRFPSRLP